MIGCFNRVCFGAHKELWCKTPSFCKSYFIFWISDFTVGNSNDLNDSTLEEEEGVGGVVGENDDDQHNASTDAVASDPGRFLLGFF